MATLLTEEFNGAAFAAVAGKAPDIGPGGAVWANGAGASVFRQTGSGQAKVTAGTLQASAYIDIPIPASTGVLRLSNTGFGMPFISTGEVSDLRIKLQQLTAAGVLGTGWCELKLSTTGSPDLSATNYVLSGVTTGGAAVSASGNNGLASSVAQDWHLDVRADGTAPLHWQGVAVGDLLNSISGNFLGQSGGSFTDYGVRVSFSQSLPGGAGFSGFYVLGLSSDGPVSPPIPPDTPPFWTDFVNTLEAL